MEINTSLDNSAILFLCNNLTVLYKGLKLSLMLSQIYSKHTQPFQLQHFTIYKLANDPFFNIFDSVSLKMHFLNAWLTIFVFYLIPQLPMRSKSKDGTVTHCHLTVLCLALAISPAVLQYWPIVSSTS